MNSNVEIYQKKLQGKRFTLKIESINNEYRAREFTLGKPYDDREVAIYWTNINGEVQHGTYYITDVFTNIDDGTWKIMKRELITEKLVS